MPGSFAVNSAYCQISLYQNDFQKMPLFQAALPTISSCKKDEGRTKWKEKVVPSIEPEEETKTQHKQNQKKDNGETHSLLEKQKEV